MTVNLSAAGGLLKGITTIPGDAYQAVLRVPYFSLMSSWVAEPHLHYVAVFNRTDHADAEGVPVYELRAIESEYGA